MSRFTFTGRLVQGDAHKAGPQRKDRNNVLLVRKDGQPDAPFFLAVAIPKNPAERFVIQGNPDYESQKAIVDADARAAWPQYFGGQRPQGLMFPASLPADCTNPKFANKILDGDGFDENGKPNNAKDGWAGCWIVKVSNGFPPKVWEWVVDWTDPRGQKHTGWKETDVTGRKIKCGDYVTIGGDASSNQNTDSPGLYMNVDTVSFEKEGEAIVGTGGVDPNQALGSRGGAPNGASAGAASTGGHAATATTSETAPAYSGYRDAAPPPPGGDAPPPPAAGPQMTAAATTSYDAYKAAGWSDDQLRAGGLMV